MSMKSAEHTSTVLVVEDEGLVRRLSADELEDAGYRVLEAASAEEAISILEDGAGVAVLFTDVNMPGGLDGLALAQLVHDRWPRVRLLVTSGGLKVDPAHRPDDRPAVLLRARNLKMARSAHAYVRGSTDKFYAWLSESAGKTPA